MKKTCVTGFILLMVGIFGFMDDGQCRDNSDVRQTTAVKLTYIDTLNQGREIGLFDNAEEPALSDEQAGISVGGNRTPEGYRIQLMASRSDDAIQEKKRGVEKNLRYKAVVEHEAPYYKLYVGNYIDRKEAEIALTTIKEAGYPDAWIVKLKVFVDE